MLYFKRLISRKLMKYTGNIVTVYVTNWYGGVEVLLPFLISEMEGNEWSDSQLGLFYAGRKASNTRLTFWRRNYFLNFSPPCI